MFNFVGGVFSSFTTFTCRPWYMAADVCTQHIKCIKQGNKNSMSGQELKQFVLVVSNNGLSGGRPFSSAPRRPRRPQRSRLTFVAILPYKQVAPTWVMPRQLITTTHRQSRVGYLQSSSLCHHPQAISTFLCFVVYVAIGAGLNACTVSLFDPGPHFAAVNHNNEIIVTDFHNHSVKVRPSHQLQMMCSLVEKSMYIFP